VVIHHQILEAVAAAVWVLLMLTVTQLAGALITVFEGLRLYAYSDTGSVMTIGFGHTVNVHPGDKCTYAQAAAWLVEDSAPLFAAVSQIQSPYEAAALVSFGYNCGATNLRKALIDRQEILNPKHTMDRTGAILQGLIYRRRLEAALCGLDA
jgi:lysozyme